MKGIIDKNRKRFFELDVWIVEDTFRIAPDNFVSRKIGDLDNRTEYNWFIPYEKGNFEDGTRLDSLSPSQAFNCLLYQRPDIMNKNNNLGIYVSVYNGGKLRWD